MKACFKKSIIIPAAGFLILSLFSCQTVPLLHNHPGLGEWIPEGAAAYIALQTTDCPNLFGALLELRHFEMSTIQELKSRTKSILIGVYGGENSPRSLVAALSGNFPRETVDWALGGTKTFKKTGEYWKAAAIGVSLRSINDGLLLLETDGAPMVDNESVNREIEAFAEVSGTVLLLLYDPAKRIIPRDEDTDIPLERASVIFTKTRTGLKGDAVYIFQEGAKPKIYLPLVKLFTFSIYRDLGFSKFESLQITLANEAAIISGGEFTEKRLASYLGNFTQ